MEFHCDADGITGKLIEKATLEDGVLHLHFHDQSDAVLIAEDGQVRFVVLLHDGIDLSPSYKRLVRERGGFDL